MGLVWAGDLPIEIVSLPPCSPQSAIDPGQSSTQLIVSNLPFFHSLLEPETNLQYWSAFLAMHRPYSHLKLPIFCSYFVFRQSLSSRQEYSLISIRLVRPSTILRLLLLFLSTHHTQIPRQSASKMHLLLSHLLIVASAGILLTSLQSVISGFHSSHHHAIDWGQSS